jgi:hypothetical protein
LNEHSSDLLHENAYDTKFQKTGLNTSLSDRRQALDQASLQKDGNASYSDPLPPTSSPPRPPLPPGPSSSKSFASFIPSPPLITPSPQLITPPQPKSTGTLPTSTLPHNSTLPNTSFHPSTPQPGQSQSTFFNSSNVDFGGLMNFMINNPQFKQLLSNISSQETEDFDPNKSLGNSGLTMAQLEERFPTLYHDKVFEDKSNKFLTMGQLATEELQRKNLSFSTPRTLEDKLKQNEKKVLVETLYKDQVDDLKLQLHDIRYSRFPVTPSTTLFQMASKHLDVNQTPINSYDLSHLKNNHQISAQAYVKAGNLAAQDLSLKLFTEPNVFKTNQGFTKFKIVERNSGAPELQSEMNLQDVKEFLIFYHILKYNLNSSLCF